MYRYDWDNTTRGYKLTTQSEKFVANELRPVYAEELALIGLDAHFTFDPSERRPLMWALQHIYIYQGEMVAKLNKVQFGKSLELELFVKPCVLMPVDVDAMIQVNRPILDALVADTLKRIKEMYEEYQSRCDITYIGFSGGNAPCSGWPARDCIIRRPLRPPRRSRCWTRSIKSIPTIRFLAAGASRTG